MPEPIQYRVDLSARRQHLVTVTVVVPQDAASDALLVLPTWTPGSYVERNYAHHVQRITARMPDGSTVTPAPDGHTAWRLPSDADGPVEVDLELYANELTVRTNHVDEHHALLIPAATFPAVAGCETRTHVVHLDAPEGQQVHSLLPAGQEHPTYEARDFDHLIDSAFEVGDHPVTEYEVAGVPHRFVYAAHGGRPDLKRVARDCEALGEAAVELLGGGLPTDDYTFLLVGWDQGGGGLEHRDGAVLMLPVGAWQDPDMYARFQSLVAHEYLHLWNVKRLVPAELTALVYDQPVHTTSLWVAEGWTAYYDDVLPLRAGLWSTQRFLDAQRDTAWSVLQTPGAAIQSVREASYHAWTGLYVQDENTPNKGVNYYPHGALLAWCLDLSIRAVAPDGDGLDGALRMLWSRFGDSRTGYTEDDVLAAVSEAAGSDMSDFFERHVRGRAVPPIEDLVDVVGLRLTPPERDEHTPAPAPELGVSISEDDQGVIITTALRGRAAWHAGITGGDRLLAIDGIRVLRGGLAPTLRGYEPGDRVEVSVFRGPRLLTVPVTLEAPRVKPALKPVPDPTDRQRAAFRHWTGRDLGDA